MGISISKATKEQSKAHNQSLVLRVIYSEGQISRADVARITGLTRPTVSSAVAELIADGLVAETGVGPSLGGKPPILLNVVDDCRYLIGVDLAESEFRGALVNLRGQIKTRLSLPIHDQDGEAALTLVHRLIDRLIAASDRPILGIGIGTPGLMDAHRNVVRHAVNLDWRNLSLGDLLEARYRMPVYIANDCQVAALAEMAFGCGKELSHLLLVKVGRGIGAGVVINRHIYYGDGFGAGEIGHVVVRPDGDQCRCGNRGCLETLASSRALVRRAQAIYDQQPDTPLRQVAASADELSTGALLKAFEMGDKNIRLLVREASLYLGQVLAVLAGALDINRIVIAGSLSRFGDALTVPIRQQIQQSILPTLDHKVLVEVSQLGQDIVILGAAALLLSQELGLS
jgi:glucokinase-like ROK family protein